VVFKRLVQGYVADRPQAAIGLIAQGRAGRDVGRRYWGDRSPQELFRQRDRKLPAQARRKIGPMEGT
jgi:hypothetical protein